MLKSLFAWSFAAIMMNHLGEARNCSTPDIPYDRQLQLQRELLPFLSFPEADQLKTIKVPTYVHVISSGPTPQEGNLPDEILMKQIKVLNQEFRHYHIHFDFQGIDRTIHPIWSTYMFYGNEVEFEAKTTLRKGGRNALNLYITSLQGGVLGYATFPFEFHRAPYMDGVVLRDVTLPGASDSQFNLGKTAVHEVGHWLGLYHTFQGGCHDRDMVDDTPPEASPASGCEIGRKTCDGHEGVDPVQNYMDYSDDHCLTHFSEGQTMRMHAHWYAYRERSHDLRSNNLS